MTPAVCEPQVEICQLQLATGPLPPPPPPSMGIASAARYQEGFIHVIVRGICPEIDDSHLRLIPVWNAAAYPFVAPPHTQGYAIAPWHQRVAYEQSLLVRHDARSSVHNFRKHRKEDVRRGLFVNMEKGVKGTIHICVCTQREVHSLPGRKRKPRPSGSWSCRTIASSVESQISRRSADERGLILGAK